MNQEVINEVVNDAAALFESSPDVYALPLYFKYEYPVRYEPYIIADAVFEAMYENSLDPTKVFDEEIGRIRFEAEFLVQSMVQDWRTICRQRAETARILNDYWPGAGFNPN